MTQEAERERDEARRERNEWNVEAAELKEALGEIENFTNTGGRKGRINEIARAALSEKVDD